MLTIWLCKPLGAAATGMIFSWLKNRRRRRLFWEPFPSQWRTHLRENVRHYLHLDPQIRTTVEQVVQVFAAEKNWLGGPGFDVTEEMKVTVAGQAAVLVLGMEEPYYFDTVQTIILYRGPYVDPVRRRYGAIRGRFRLSGEMWYRGPIVLSWRDALAAGRNESGGRNVVFHEFAHYVDGLDGDVDGSPPLISRQQRQLWYRVTEAEYLRLVGQTQRNEVTLFDQYGATNRAEFFAVATECFFEQPQAMQRQHEELYDLLCDFYRQEPSTWLPDAKAADQPTALSRPAPKTAEVRRWRQRRLAILRSRDPTALFTLAVEYFDERRYRLAARVATRLIELDPADGEARQQRAMARVKLGRYAAAWADADEALQRDPDDWGAYRARGAACVGLGEYLRAKDDLDRALAENNNDALARYYRGRAWMGLGRPRRAVSDYAKSLGIQPFAAEVFYHSGLANHALGDLDEAEADLAKAFQLDPLVDQRP
jgi:hypothetical protein